MTVAACCICSSLLDTYDPETEKAIVPERHLGCCGRTICARCIRQNSRYETYCPYCQISSEPTTLPQGLKDPPAYTTLDEKQPVSDNKYVDDDLPAYSASEPKHVPPEKSTDEPAQDVLHFVTPNDTPQSLSLAYAIPLNAFRKTNNLFADHLLQGRKTVLIPGEYYKGGVSLSPQPLESEEEEIKKNKIRRWMVTCKVSEYDVAVLYLEQAEYNLEAAIQAYQEDERWEKEHPMDDKGKSRSKKAIGMRRFTGFSRVG